jgi:hypothetical protein
LVTDADTIKICDFGMALVGGVAFSGPDSMQIGSPCYMPPEQRKNPKGVDGRADLYSAAVLLYRMLTGKLPGMQSFSLSLVNPIYDQSWDEFFAKALRWQPDERFQNAGEMLFAFDQLALGQSRGGGSCSTPVSRQQPVKLRSEPVNVCLSRARAHFAVNELFRPTISVCNRLEIGKETVVDRATGLAWQRSGSRYPLTFAGAHEYVEGLNLRDYGGYRQWRLPTINELLSLLPDDGDLEVFPESLGRPVKWLWSCDRHGHHESWYVNMDMRFAGVQDVNCLNHVRAVAAVAL